MVDQCRACPEHGIVYMGGAWWCPEHLYLGVTSALEPTDYRLVEHQDAER